MRAVRSAYTRIPRLLRSSRITPLFERAKHPDGKSGTRAADRGVVLGGQLLQQWRAERAAVHDAEGIVHDAWRTKEPDDASKSATK